MKQKSGTRKATAELVVKDIRRNHRICGLQVGEITRLLPSGSKSATEEQLCLNTSHRLCTLNRSNVVQSRSRVLRPVAVIDCIRGRVDPRNDPRRTDHDSTNAAYYYPWVTISDPRTGTRKELPPGGFVCGIYARSDNAAGVWKAPANEIVTGTIGLKHNVNQRTQEALSPQSINVFRRFPRRGIRVWGARTVSSDSLWRYVNVRRLFIFIESLIYTSTQWVVCEPNDRRLWARVKQIMALFLRTQWRDGALFGTKEKEAFRVLVGRETMTEDVILNDRPIIEVGIAPVRPAEFVIFRVYQKTHEAES